MGFSLLILALQPGARYRAPRTERALRRSGFSSQIQTVHSLPQFRLALSQTSEPVWIIQAGAWPKNKSIEFPPSSQTRRPLCALGALLAQPDLDCSGAQKWKKLLQTTGGNLDESLAQAASNTDVFPELFSVYLETSLVAALARKLEDPTLSFPQALLSILRETHTRTIRWPSLDVFHDPRLRVAEVITSFQRGGAERLVLDLHETLPAQGVFSSIIVTGRPTRGTFPAPKDSINVSSTSGDRAGRFSAAAQAALQMHADVVHAHLLSPAEARIFREQQLPVVMTLHNTRAGWPENFLQLCPQDAHLVVACSRCVEDDFCSAGLQIPVRTIWNGIDFNKYSRTEKTSLSVAAQTLRQSWGVSPDQMVLLAIANPRPQKRLELLPAVLAAVNQLLQQGSSNRSAWLMIAGETSGSRADAQQATAQLHAAIQASGIQARIRLLGPVDNVPELLQACNVLVSSSAWEGLSLAMLEALASGIPVVATEVGGAAEIAKNNPAMRLIPAEFSPEQAASAIMEVVLAIPVEDHAIPAKNFRRETMSARYAQIFPRVIATNCRPKKNCGRGLLLVTNNFSTGGAQSSAYRLLKALAKRGHAVSAAVVQEQPEFPTAKRQSLEQAGIQVLALPTAGSCDAAHALAMLLETIDNDPPESVIMWNLIPEYKVLLADLLLDTRLIDVSPGEMYFSSLERYFNSARPGLPYTSENHYGKKLSAAVVKYEAERSLAERLLGCAVSVIPNGIFVPEQPPQMGTRSGRLVMGTSARISPQKKLEELFTALRMVHDQLPSYVLKIAGGPDGPLEDYAANLRRQAEGLNVEWLGHVEDLTGFLRELELFVMISEPAGCPNASLEAMAAGLPVIATDFGGARDQIIDGLTGRLLPRGDPTALAQAILDAATTQREQLPSWGLAGWERARTLFSIEKMCEAYERVCFPSLRACKIIPCMILRRNFEGH